MNAERSIRSSEYSELECITVFDMFNGTSNRDETSRFDAKFSVHGDAKSNAACINRGA